ncbi:hypothetical protein HMPREF1986_01434 [Oribacterium sp. oral taxon 078 str. F0263]|nr:hypothetical protein HMPREF1986_01434 [Oribacterium sp. oral taxon 078 str. F0263]
MSCDGQNPSIFQNTQSHCLLYRVTKTQDFYLPLYDRFQNAPI